MEHPNSTTLDGARTPEAGRIEALERQVAELTALLRQRPAGGEAPAGAPLPPPSTSRRGVLKLAGAAAAGAFATGVARPAPAAAIIGSPMQLGNAGTAGTDPYDATTDASDGMTRYDFLPTVEGTGFLFQAGDQYGPADSIYPSALAGWTTNEFVPHGIYGYTEETGYGVVAYGSGETASGLLVRGEHHHLRLEGFGDAPSARTTTHEVGEMIVDSTGDLWLCTAAGTPGTWRKLAGAMTAGAYHAIAPSRVYDSRLGEPAGNVGIMGNNTNRTVSVADSRNLETGAVVTAGIVPAGATAVSANIAVDGTVGSGFLTINPGGDTEIRAAAINWSETGQILNNGLNLTLNATREVTVICGGGGQTHVVIDITGYYL